MMKNHEAAQTNPSVWAAPDVVLNTTDEHGQPLKLRPISLGAAALLVFEQRSRNNLQWVAETLLEIQPRLTDISFNLSFESKVDDNGYPLTRWHCELDGAQLASAVGLQSNQKNKTATINDLEGFFDLLNENIDSDVLLHWLESCEKKGVVTFNLQKAIANNAVQPKLYITVAE